MGRLGWKIVAVATLAQAAAPQEPTTFRVGTRLVEVDVVVRNKNGPVSGLTRDDFTVFECKRQPRLGEINSGTTSWCKDKQQAIQVFQGPETNEAETPPTRSAPSPGLVSNRVDSRGAAIVSATVLLFDQLNVSFDHKEYERTQVTKFLKSLRGSDRIAIYSLGHGLHILQDFTDDPQKLVTAVSKLDSGLDALQAIRGDPSLEVEPAPTKTGDAVTDMMIAKAVAGAGAANPAILEMFDQITMAALRKIVQHMSGVPGRKNLIWVKDAPQLTLLPENAAKARSILREANIALYPVVVRSLQGSGVFSMTASLRPSPPPMMDLAIQKAARDLGTSMGGAGFGDAADIGAAVSRAEEDSGSAYLLGFYPSETDLDGKVHTLNVALSRKFARAGLELSFRRQYLAVAKPPKIDSGSMNDLFDSPLDASAIGLSAIAKRDQTESGVYHLAITVNLADVQLREQGDRWVGSLRMAMRRDQPGPDGVIVPTEPIVQIQPISLSGDQFQARATTGFLVRQRWTGLGAAGSLRIVVQDQTNGATGSLRVLLGKGKE
jgi:VWFA-related protein